MDKINDGGPAFPVPGDQQYREMNGMSLRDWFAGQALNAALALSPPVMPEQIAAVAYAIADAMLKARTPTDGDTR